MTNENGSNVVSDPSIKVIKSIDQDSIKFIAAGEKINDLETVVRELVENSIDAGANVIEIRLGRFGAESIEVEDNGPGIEESNFDEICLRYHTSKIDSFDVLQKSLTTFGFRGEALSCLCNISHLTLTTKTQSSPTGTKLTFNADGTISKKEHVARGPGTTVFVRNLFHNLPVRKRELETTAKRHYDKIVKLIYEHVLCRSHIKFSLVKKHGIKKDKDFTHGGTTLENCITTIFGVKVFESLIQINPELLKDVNKITPDSTDECLSNSSHDTSVDGTSNNEDCIITSHRQDTHRNSFFSIERTSIVKSKYATKDRLKYCVYGYISKIGCGRNSTDCQFLFLNNKPCNLPKLTKTINETYRKYSPSQYPFVCFFIKVQNWAADFNVPRKREVILQDGDKLCEIVESSLVGLFASIVPAAQTSCEMAQIPIKTMKQETINSDGIKHISKREHDGTDTNDGPPLKKLTTTTTNGLTTDCGGASTEGDNCLLSDDLSTPSSDSPIYVPINQDSEGNSNVKECPHLANVRNANNSRQSNMQSSDFVTALDLMNEQAAEKSSTPTVSTDANQLQLCLHPASFDIECLYKQTLVNDSDRLQAKIENHLDLRIAMERERTQRQMVNDSKEFSYAIHPNFNSAAEEELKFNLNKNSFLDMQILGQFNRGFIVARLNKHLFIIDQHATDERANFEDQLDKSPLIKQRMVMPKPLYLNSIQENTIMNNLEAFENRGFEFKIDKDKIAGMRVMLTATSICKGQGMDECLTKEDVVELVDIIAESPNQSSTYTLKKVKSVAASRACRKSVMIGDKLSWHKMTEIVRKMARLNNPWVCAHNRPTIRHLMDVDWMN